MTEEYHRSMVFSIHRFIMRLLFTCLSKIYTTSLKLLDHNFFAKSLLFIIERRGGAAPLMTKVTSLRRTMKMKILIMLAAGRTSAAASKRACPACFFLFMRFPSLPSIVLHSPFFFQSVKKTRDIASATSLGQTCSLRFDGADFDFVDFSLFDFKD